MEQKTALVTGAARGIGLATTKLFLEAGWSVVMVDRDAEVLQSEAAALDNATAIVCDVSDPQAVDDMAAEAVAINGRIDAVVNNAGVADFGPIEETDFARWRRVMETNLDGVFLVSQALIPALKITKGALLNIASISGLRASTLRVAYGTSKAAVIQLTKQQAAELGEYGIRANCVCPGPVRTKLAMAVHSQPPGDRAARTAAADDDIVVLVHAPVLSRVRNILSVYAKVRRRGVAPQSAFAARPESSRPERRLHAVAAPASERGSCPMSRGCRRGSSPARAAGRKACASRVRARCRPASRSIRETPPTAG